MEQGAGVGQFWTPIQAIGGSLLHAGLQLAAIGRYLKGIGEPTTSTLEKLAGYFEVSVAWLRGDLSIDAQIVHRNLEIILSSVRTLMQKIGKHEEILHILDATMEINSMIGSIIVERNDLYFKDMDGRLKEIEDNITRQIEAAGGKED